MTQSSSILKTPQTFIFTYGKIQAVPPMDNFVLRYQKQCSWWQDMLDPAIQQDKG